MSKRMILHRRVQERCPARYHENIMLELPWIGESIGSKSLTKAGQDSFSPLAISPRDTTKTF